MLHFTKGSLDTCPSCAPGQYLYTLFQQTHLIYKNRVDCVVGQL